MNERFDALAGSVEIAARTSFTAGMLCVLVWRHSTPCPRHTAGVRHSTPRLDIYYVFDPDIFDERCVPCSAARPPLGSALWSVSQIPT